MLWCRDSFDSLGAVLQHIPLCPCLDDGYYWCMQCSRPERFMEKGKPLRKELRTDQCQRKDSKLKRAASFFKGFGHVSPNSKHRAKSCGTTVLEASGAILTLGLTSLIEKKRRKSSSDFDPNSDKEVLDPQVSSLKDADLLQHLYKLDNLETEDLCKLLNDFGAGEQCQVLANGKSDFCVLAETFLRSETEMAGLEVVVAADVNSTANQATPNFDPDYMPCAELDGTEQFLQAPNLLDEQWRSVSPMPSTFDGLPFSPTPISPLVTAGIPSAMGAGDAFLDPMFTTLDLDDQAPPRKRRSRRSNSSRSRSTNPSNVSSIAPTSAPSSLLLYSTPDHMALPEADRDSRFLENSTFRSAETRVKEIRELVSIVNQEWLERMTGAPRLLSRCAGLSTAVLFEKGVTALQQCFRGILPDTFLEVFGLMHIACAVAYSFHKEDDWWMWEELSMDMAHWQDTLPRDSEKEFFLEALAHLNRPRTPLGGWLKQINPATTSIYQSSGPAETEASGIMLPRNMLLDKSQSFSEDHLFCRLRQGRVMQDCTRFLDRTLTLALVLTSLIIYLDLEHSVLAERNKALLPGHFAWYTQQKSANIAHLLDHVIWPLRATGGFEALRDIIVDAEFQVKSGLLRTPREIEVALVYGGKVNFPLHSRSHSLTNSALLQEPTLLRAIQCRCEEHL